MLELRHHQRVQLRTPLVEAVLPTAVPLGVTLGIASALLTALITEVYAHRCLAHRAFRLHPRLDRILDTYFRVVVGTDPESWAAVHRLHHRYADTPLDPHSPVLRHPLAVLLGSPYLFAVARRRLPANPPGRRWNHLVIRVGVVVVFAVAIGPVGVLVMFAVHLVAYLGIMGTVNTVGHLYGTKPHPEAPGYDAAWLAIPLLGHGYHNSHHAHPAAARTGRLDPVWPLLVVMGWARLVDLHRPNHEAGERACCTAVATSAG